MTCKQLRALVQAYPKADQALQLLLSNSYRLRRQQQHQRQQARLHAAADSDSEQDVETPSADGNFDDDDDCPYSDIEDDDFEEEHSWFALKTDIPVCDSVRAGKVPETDERTPLRGMNGIWAARDVHAGHVLGKCLVHCIWQCCEEVLMLLYTCLIPISDSNGFYVCYVRFVAIVHLEAACMFSRRYRAAVALIVIQPYEDGVGPHT